jgi:SAM-dependent methyltransferase
MSAYTNFFFQFYQRGARVSAEQIVPLIMQAIHPRKVIDVGCGVGTWLAVFQKQGVENVTGIDGAYVNREQLRISPTSFQPMDLTQPKSLGEQYDLAVSLEVAEHLPAEKATAFVDFLTSLGRVVLFSAAIPFQAGRGHINNQWPDYWTEKFAAKGYKVVDYLRPKVWKNHKVKWWYAQNILLFADESYLEQNPELKEAALHTDNSKIRRMQPMWYFFIVWKIGWLLLGAIALGYLCFRFLS